MKIIKIDTFSKYHIALTWIRHVNVYYDYLNCLLKCFKTLRELLQNQNTFITFIWKFCKYFSERDESKNSKDLIECWATGTRSICRSRTCRHWWLLVIPRHAAIAAASEWKSTVNPSIHLKQAFWEAFKYAALLVVHRLGNVERKVESLNLNLRTWI